MPQASNAVLPNQNGHHARLATNAHKRMRSTMAAGILFETPKASLCWEKIVPDVRDGTSTFMRCFPRTIAEISLEEGKAQDKACYHTSGESPFTRQNKPVSPRKQRRAGSRSP